jgi:hypothetical protein
MTSSERNPTLRGSFRASRRHGSNRRNAALPLTTRIASAWKAGSGCIPAGLVGSFLTCVASVGVNLFIDAGGTAFPAALYLRKFATGYAAAATVVVVLFPLLPALNRRRRSNASSLPPG